MKEKNEKEIEIQINIKRLKLIQTIFRCSNLYMTDKIGSIITSTKKERDERSEKMEDEEEAKQFK